MSKSAIYLYPKKSASAATPWWLAGGIDPANCVAAYQAIGAASQEASYVNLANPGTYDCIVTTAPTWNSSYGWAFVAALSQYLDTGVIAAGDCSYSIIIRYSNWSAGYIIGNIATTGTHFICITPHGGGVFSGHGVWSGTGNCTVDFAPPLTGGVYAVAGKQSYRNGVAEASAIAAGTGSASMYIIIGARHINGNGTPDEYSTCKIQAACIYDTTLTAPQVLALSDAMAALP